MTDKKMLTKLNDVMDGIDKVIFELKKRIKKLDS